MFEYCTVYGSLNEADFNTNKLAADGWTVQETQFVGMMSLVVDGIEKPGTEMPCIIRTMLRPLRQAEQPQHERRPIGMRMK